MLNPYELKDFFDINIAKKQKVMTLLLDSDIFYDYSFDWIKKEGYKNVTYETPNFYETEKLGKRFCHAIRFTYSDELELNFLENVENYLKDSFYNGYDIDRILKILISHFANRTKNIDLNKLKGDIGEALFIYKTSLINSNIGKTISQSFHMDDLSPFDFYVKKDNKFIEIKTTTKANSTINYSSSQNIEPNLDVNLFVVIVRFLQNQKNIIDIYEDIHKLIGLSPQLGIKKLTYKSIQLLNEDLLNSYTVNYDDVNFYLYKKEYLPRIDFSVSPKIKKITYSLDATISSMDERAFDEIIKEIIN